MLISRGVQLGRLVNIARGKRLSASNVRNSGSHANYRCPPEDPSKGILYFAEFVQGVAWWWVLWHLWTEPGHIFGEFEYPDAHQWTDEELGIPPIE